MWGPETTTTVDPTKSALVEEKLGKEGGKTEQKSDDVNTASMSCQRLKSAGCVALRCDTI